MNQLTETLQFIARCALMSLYFTGRHHGVTTASDEALSLVSHATECRLKNILNKLAVISQHRMEVLKVSDANPNSYKHALCGVV